MLPEVDRTAARVGRLRLEGAVDFTVDGPLGSTAGSARGDGPVLRVTTDDPAVAWDAVAQAAPGASALGALADALHDQGLAVEVSGPRGVLATVGAGADSALGRAVTGSRHVRPGRPAALGPLVLARLRSRARRRAPLLAALAAGVLLAARRRARRH
ncbi:MAG: hypothetical protein AVDCRST_MAG07-3123 [uncultured Frankineae bacterium]|uniref:Uncharacterized protein n=1 Tax=uncultured Frankineae bacterium TaxID=437475 RepID=A0A6J4M7T2_9ACTN|nr:MAG: hypothetical protein AVDCRST_MAG07-3123 [uncultured Frankineae bacterium]